MQKHPGGRQDSQKKNKKKKIAFNEELQNYQKEEG